MNYRREIDGLRALAVLPVVFFHAGFETFRGGFVGVDVFFVISGYLITTIILEEREKGKFSIVHFYERRARRILPALFLVMLVCIPFACFLLFPQDLISFSKSLMAISAFISNIFFWTERGYFGEAIEFKPLIHTWSLAIEEQYYLFFPIFLMIFARRKILRNIFLIILFVVSFGLCIWLTPIHQDTAFFLLPTRIWELLVGSLVAIFLENIDVEQKLGKSCWGDSLSILGICLVFYAVFFFDKTTIFPGYAAFVPVLGTALIIGFTNEKSVSGKILGFRGGVFIGLLSYSAYLWHQPIFSFVRHSHIERSAIVSTLLILLTFALSYVSWRFVEQPWRKNPYTKTTVFCSAFAGLVFFAAIGSAGILNKGFLDRYTKEEILVLKNFLYAGDYVWNRFDKLKLASFDLQDQSRKKVLVIGDSYGQDLVNAIYESGLIEKLQISTYQINSECGNLYLEEDFTKEIDLAKLPRCRVLGWYDNEKLVQLMKKADYVWLASAWSLWVANRLPMSVDRLEKDFGKPVIVFGTKNFGEVDLRTLLRIPYEQRQRYLNAIAPNSYQIQNSMRESLSAKNFIDIGFYFCGSDYLRCRLFNDIGEPLTFDGQHLTKAGAKFLGKAFAAYHTFTPYLQ